MKKRIGIILLALVAAFGCVACGQKKEEQKNWTVTIDKKQYTLSEDVRDVIGEMVDNDIVVVHMSKPNVFDDKGKLQKKTLMQLRKENSELGNVVYADEAMMTAHPDCNIVVTRYFLDGRLVAYKTTEGITEKSTEKDLEALSGYVPYTAMKRGTAYAAIFVDGQLVDLGEYEDEMEEIMETVEEKGLVIAVQEHGISFPSSCMLSSINLSVLPQTQSEDVVEGCLLIALAAQEADEELNEEDIDSYDIVVYENTEDGMDTYFYHYHYDDNWDKNKFSPN